MRPSSIQLLEAIAQNLDQLVLPAGTNGRTRNTVHCAALLLHHVAARSHLEVPLLREDNADKRRTLALAAQRLTVLAEQRDAPDLVRLASGVKARIPGRSVPTADVASLSAENESLKTVFAALLAELREHRHQLGADDLDSLLSVLRRQLRRQIDRETRLIPPELNQPVYDIGLPVQADPGS